MRERDRERGEVRERERDLTHADNGFGWLNADWLNALRTHCQITENTNISAKAATLLRQYLFAITSVLPSVAPYIFKGHNPQMKTTHELQTNIPLAIPNTLTSNIESFISELTMIFEPRLTSLYVYVYIYTVSYTHLTLPTKLSV